MSNSNMLPFVLGTGLLLLTSGAQFGASAHYALQPVHNPPPADVETSGYLLPRLADKYRPESGNWDEVIDPKLYLLTEPDHEAQLTGAGRTQDQQQGDAELQESALSGGLFQMSNSNRREKRTNGPSLSIVNPLDVLRQRLLLEIARRRMRQSEDQIIANREWLKTIGKRSIDKKSLQEVGKAAEHGNHGWSGHS